MSQSQVKNPLHGITLEQVVTKLADHYGWMLSVQKLPSIVLKATPR